MTIFESCSAAHEGDLEAVVQCVANWVEEDQAKTVGTLGRVDPEDLNNWLILLTGSLIFFMQPGFAMLCAGAVRKKNVNNTMLKNLLDASGAAVAFYVMGYAIAYGGETEKTYTFAGNDDFFLSTGKVNPAIFFFQYTFCAASVTIVASTLAERCTMISYLCFSVVTAGIVYPVVVHCIWSGTGYLSNANAKPIFDSGMADFAGSGVVHMTGGSTALYASYILGPRRGRFRDSSGNKLSQPGLTKGHSTALQMLGTMILWFGWYGFNPGSALVLGVEGTGLIAARAAVNTTLAAASGAISTLLVNAFVLAQSGQEFELDIVMAMNGCLSGLVAVTGSCGLIDHWAAVIIGISAGWIYLISTKMLVQFEIDDAVDAIPVHLFCGIWGVIATGLFSTPEALEASFGSSEHPGWFYDPNDARLLASQIVGVLFILGWTFFTMYPFFLLLDYFSCLRVNALEELVGLDASYHGGLPPTKLFDQDGSTSEEARLEAYQKRFVQKKTLREKRGKRFSVEDLMNVSWGAAEFDKDSSEGDQSHKFSEFKLSGKDQPPESAPPRRRKRPEHGADDNQSLGIASIMSQSVAHSHADEESITPSQRSMGASAMSQLLASQAHGDIHVPSNHSTSLRGDTSNRDPTDVLSGNSETQRYAKALTNEIL